MLWTRQKINVFTPPHANQFMSAMFRGQNRMTTPPQQDLCASPIERTLSKFTQALLMVVPRVLPSCGWRWRGRGRRRVRFSEHSFSLFLSSLDPRWHGEWTVMHALRPHSLANLTHLGNNHASRIYFFSLSLSHYLPSLRSIWRFFWYSKQ